MHYSCRICVSFTINIMSENNRAHGYTYTGVNYNKFRMRSVKNNISADECTFAIFNSYPPHI